MNSLRYFNCDVRPCDQQIIVDLFSGDGDRVYGIVG